MKITEKWLALKVKKENLFLLVTFCALSFCDFSITCLTWDCTLVHSISTPDELSAAFIIIFFQTCCGEVTRVLRENLPENKIVVSPSLHIFGKANLLHLSSCIFLAHQKAWPAVFNSTNTFQHGVCTKNSIRYCEVTEMNETRTRNVKTLNSVGRKAVQTTVMQSRTNVGFNAWRRGVL